MFSYGVKNMFLKWRRHYSIALDLNCLTTLLATYLISWCLQLWQQPLNARRQIKTNSSWLRVPALCLLCQQQSGTMSWSTANKHRSRVIPFFFCSLFPSFFLLSSHEYTKKKTLQSLNCSLSHARENISKFADCAAVCAAFQCEIPPRGWFESAIRILHRAQKERDVFQGLFKGVMQLPLFLALALAFFSPLLAAYHT